MCQRACNRGQGRVVARQTTRQTIFEHGSRDRGGIQYQYLQQGAGGVTIGIHNGIGKGLLCIDGHIIGRSVGVGTVRIHGQMPTQRCSHGAGRSSLHQEGHHIAIHTVGDPDISGRIADGKADLQYGHGGIGTSTVHTGSGIHIRDHIAGSWRRHGGLECGVQVIDVVDQRDGIPMVLHQTKLSDRRRIAADVQPHRVNLNIVAVHKAGPAGRDIPLVGSAIRQEIDLGFIPSQSGVRQIRRQLILRQYEWCVVVGTATICRQTGNTGLGHIRITGLRDQYSSTGKINDREDQRHTQRHIGVNHVV